MNSLSIKNYKNLEDIQINNLGTVNLIAGENNVGKSSLLEGISILQAGGRIDWLKQLLKFRGEGTIMKNAFRKRWNGFFLLFRTSIKIRCLI